MLRSTPLRKFKEQFKISSFIIQEQGSRTAHKLLKGVQEQLQYIYGQIFEQSCSYKVQEVHFLGKMFRYHNLCVINRDCIQVIISNAIYQMASLIN